MNETTHSAVVIDSAAGRPVHRCIVDEYQVKGGGLLRSTFFRGRTSSWDTYEVVFEYGAERQVVGSFSARKLAHTAMLFFREGLHSARYFAGTKR